MADLTEKQYMKMCSKAEEIFMLLRGHCERCKKEIQPEHCDGCRIGGVVTEIMEAK